MFCDAVENWREARTRCKNHGMRLARVDDVSELQWMFQQAQMRGVVDRWLSGTDEFIEGEWRWADGERFWLGAADGMMQNDLYAPWGLNEPDGDTNENCLKFIDENSSPVIVDKPCLNDQAFICEDYPSP